MKNRGIIRHGVTIRPWSDGKEKMENGSLNTESLTVDWVFAERSKGVLYRVLFCCSLGECVAIQGRWKRNREAGRTGSEFWTEAWSAFFTRVLYNIWKKKDGLTG